MKIINVEENHDGSATVLADITYDELRELAAEALHNRIATAAVVEIDKIKDAEIERLRIKCDKQAMILQRLRPEYSPGVYFICGQLGPVDKDGLPEKVMIVPEYGCDWSQIYVKTERQTGPEW